MKKLKGAIITSNAVYIYNECVFWSEIQAGMGIIEDNTRTIVYAEELENPSTWKKLSECDKQSKVLDYRNGKLYAHVFNGNGVIESEDTKFTIKEPVQDSVVIKDGFLVVCMRDAKSVPALYSKDSKILMEFPLDSPRGLVSTDSYRDIALLVMSGFGTPMKFTGIKMKNWKKSNPIVYQGTI